MTERLNWENVRTLIEGQVGPVLAAHQVSQGVNSQIAVIVNTRDASFFVKGLRVDHPRAWTQDRERAVNPHVAHLSARLRWSLRSEGWDLLGFEELKGRGVDYTPGSPDLEAVVDTLTALGHVHCPGGVETKHAEQRWATFTPAARMFAGEQLLHTEFSPGNVLITGEGARLVDWAWPTRGAAWIDPACWAVWLIAHGHTPHQAQTWARRVPSYRQAPATGVDEFARVQAAMWAGIAREDPDDWTRRMAHAARHWAAHRAP